VDLEAVWSDDEPPWLGVVHRGREGRSDRGLA
jgi:hypothetical protein